ncbi:FG-GAP-like repeat-containing protein [Cellvibrio fontiphilus]|uniref:FG-GAP-like repeat-containing protein n=1 Tax=Cellvibrio fontiphilus TaxID=1815559 RepID=A0ABV7FEP9_9GAMM
MRSNTRSWFAALLCIPLFAINSLAQAQALAPKSKPVPKPIEEVIQIVNHHCGACHKVPPPNILPKQNWPRVVQTMADLSHKMMSKVFISEEHLHDIKAYYYGSSPTELPRLPYLPASKSPVVFQVRELGARSSKPLAVDIAPGLTGTARDFLLADAEQKKLVQLFRTGDEWQEKILASAEVPVNTQVIDIDADGDKDILLADLGMMPPASDKVGKVYLLRQQAKGEFKQELLLGGLGRVTDAQAADLDADGDLDIAIAVFGGNNQGEIIWLENRAGQYHKHQLFAFAGALNITPADLNGDGLLDLVALIAQEHEMIVAFINRGAGQFEKGVLARAPHPMFGSTSMTLVDMDKDRDVDIVFTNGDAFDLQTEPKPYHGVQWLENRGTLQFQFHDIGRFYGAAHVVAGDIDGDGDVDVVASSWVNFWRDPNRQTLVWYENNGQQKFTAHPIASQPAGLVSLQLVDVTGDGRLDIVAAAFRMDLLLDDLGFNSPPEARPDPTTHGKQNARVLVFENKAAAK